MLTELWRSSDLFDLLRSLYTAKMAALQFHGSEEEGSESSPGQSPLFYQQGCQMAVQTLLLALGYLPQDFYQADPDETTRRGRGRELWLRSELGSLIASIYDAFTSPAGWLPQDGAPADPAWTTRHDGFYDMLAQVLQALGLPTEILQQEWQPPPPIEPRIWIGDDTDAP